MFWRGGTPGSPCGVSNTQRRRDQSTMHVTCMILDTFLGGVRGEMDDICSVIQSKGGTCMKW